MVKIQAELQQVGPGTRTQNPKTPTQRREPPPTYDPNRYLSDAAKRTADWLRMHGVEVLSVLERGGNLEKTPGAVAVAGDVTLEFKDASRPTANAVTKQIRRAAQQAAHIVVDAKSANIPIEIAEQALRSTIRMRGARLAEILIILQMPDPQNPEADGVAVSWAHG